MAVYPALRSTSRQISATAILAVASMNRAYKRCKTLCTESTSSELSPRHIVAKISDAELFGLYESFDQARLIRQNRIFARNGVDASGEIHLVFYVCTFTNVSTGMPMDSKAVTRL